MARRERSLAKKFFLTIVIFVFVAAVAFFGIQFLTKTGIFRIPGVVYYDESLNDDESEKLKTIFTDEIELDKDVHISAENYLYRPDLSEGEFVEEIFVPVADFYNSKSNIEITNIDELFTNCMECDYKFIAINDLDFTQKLLSINDKYFLDDFNSGAVFRVIKFSSDRYTDEIMPLVSESFTKVFPEKETVLSFAQTGVTALSRGMNEKLYQIGDAKYFSEKIADFLSEFDLTHTSNESSFSDYASSNNICSDKRFIDTLGHIGLDIVELTGNHNQDCGDEAALESINIYNEKGIKVVGGGKTAKEAAIPLEIDEKDSKITLLAYNLSTGGATYDDTPGANQYHEENAASDIKIAKERGDFVIVDVQYYECSMYVAEYEDSTCDYADSAAGDQVGFFRHLIDLGADVVVGTSAHQPQTFELYGDGVIYYGLGNLFFDQIWWPGTTRSLVLSHYFYNGKLLQTNIVPTIYDSSMQTKLMDREMSEWFIRRLMNARP